MISAGPIPDPPAGTVALEFEYGRRSGAGATTFVALFVLACLAFLGVLGSGSALWLTPLFLLASAVFALQARQPIPRMEIRADGMLLSTLLLGDKLFIPWSAIQDVDTQPMMSTAFFLDVGDRSGALMDAGLIRVIEDFNIRIFAGGQIGIITPDGISPEKLRDIVESRILENSRKGIGLIGSPDRENTL